MTNAQYAEFLNKAAQVDPFGLYNAQMGITRTVDPVSHNASYSVTPTSADKPVTFVSFWDAARFANWLSNGQPETRTPEDDRIRLGAYDLTVPEALTNNTVTRVDYWATKKGLFFIANQNEWYKAAYFDPSVTGPRDQYWAYPTRSDVAPKSTGPNIGNPNSANFDDAVEGLVSVGGYEVARGPWLTFDQGGNASEWTDTIYPDNVEYRLIRGGSYLSVAERLSASSADYGRPTEEFSTRGFRLVQITPIPEPAHLVALFAVAALGTRLLVAFRARERRL